jgi:hypothetical protein
MGRRGKETEEKRTCSPSHDASDSRSDAEDVSDRVGVEELVLHNLASHQHFSFKEERRIAEKDKKTHRNLLLGNDYARLGTTDGESGVSGTGDGLEGVLCGREEGVSTSTRHRFSAASYSPLGRGRS